MWEFYIKKDKCTADAAPAPNLPKNFIKFFFFLKKTKYLKMYLKIFLFLKK